MGPKKRVVKAAKTVTKNVSNHDGESQQAAEGESSKEGTLWAFIYWIETDEWSIQPKESIINSEMYSDPERIGLVEHVKADSEPPTNGWTSYKARVLCVNENKVELERQGIEKLDAVRKSLKLVDTSSSLLKPEENQQGPGFTQDVGKVVESVQREGCASLEPESRKRKIENAEESRGSTSNCVEGNNFNELEEMEMLKERNKLLEKEIKKLKFTIEDLKLDVELLTERNQRFRDRLSNVSKVPSEEVLQQPLEALRDDGATTDGSESPSPSKANDCRQNLLKYVSETKLSIAEVGVDKWTKLTSNLMDCIFTRETLISSSISGKGTNKPRLNPYKVAAIVGYICYKFAGKDKCCKTAIVSKMGNHLRDLRKLEKHDS